MAGTWIDGLGNEWTTEINVNTIRRVKEIAAVNLMDALDGHVLHRLSEDPEAMAKTLWAICKPQADAKNVNDAAFAEGLTGEALEQAGSALIEALIRFFPKSRREVLRRVWEEINNGEASVVQMAMEKLDSETMKATISQIVQNASNQIDQQLTELGRPSTNSPE